MAPEGPAARKRTFIAWAKYCTKRPPLGTGRISQSCPPISVAPPKQQTALLELNEVLLKACEGDPRNRYQSAEEMHEDLLLLRSGKSLVRLRLAERRFKWARRSSVAAAVIALLGGLAYWNQVRQTQVVRTLAQEKSALAEKKANWWTRNPGCLKRAGSAWSD